MTYRHFSPKGTPVSTRALVATIAAVALSAGAFATPAEADLQNARRSQTQHTKSTEPTRLTAPPTADKPAGPPLRVTAAQARKALKCTGVVDRSSRPPVLLIHGTTSNPKNNWSWNWVRTLDARRWAHCEITLPESGNGDIQVAAEYVVRAIRSMSAEAGRRRIDVVGHSQGGMIARWALKYWPDTRQKVDDLVGLASSNYGTQDFNMLCSTGSCSAANWQQRRGSSFLTALNHGTDVWSGISYTQIATVYDEIIIPYTSPFLRPSRTNRQVVNTTVQEVCPLEMVEHFGMSYSNGAWLIALDALTHRGPSRVDRISRATCTRLFMPGVEVSMLPGNLAAVLAQTALSSLTAEQLSSEPRLRQYAASY
jgi:triacylglycerol lipase